MTRSIDSVAAAGEGLFLLLGRVLIGILYIPGGYHHLTDLNAFAHQLASSGVPGPAMAWAIVGALIEFFASLAVVVGWKTRWAALLLMAFTVGASLIGHPFWAAPEAQFRNQYIHFSKNLAIIGGLLFVFVRGPGPISIDRR